MAAHPKVLTQAAQLILACLLGAVVALPVDTTSGEDCAQDVSSVSLLQTSFEVSQPLLHVATPRHDGVKSLSEFFSQVNSNVAPTLTNSRNSDMDLVEWFTLDIAAKQALLPDKRWLHLVIALTFLAGVAFGIVHNSRWNFWGQFIPTKLLAPAAMMVVYCVWSIGIVYANKHLANAVNFPHPIALVGMHMMSAALISHGLLWIMSKRSHPESSEAVPEVTTPCEETYGVTSMPWVDSFAHMRHINAIGQESCNKLFRTVFVIAAFTAVVLVLENAALCYSTIPFLQLMKEFGLVYMGVWTYLLGGETNSYSRWTLIAFILVGCCLCVHGEMQFALTGFLMQLISTGINSLKIVIQARLLVDKKLKVDPLSYAALVTPACALVLLPCAIIEANLSTGSVLAAVKANQAFILLNCALAGGFNVVLAATILWFGATGFALVGCFKNALIIALAVVVLGQPTSLAQMMGCAVIFVCVPLCSVMDKGGRPEAQSAEGSKSQDLDAKK